jgi:hypothetical protein
MQCTTWHQCWCRFYRINLQNTSSFPVNVPCWEASLKPPREGLTQPERGWGSWLGCGAVWSEWWGWLQEGCHTLWEQTLSQVRDKVILVLLEERLIFCKTHSLIQNIEIYSQQYQPCWDWFLVPLSLLKESGKNVMKWLSH